MCIAEATLRGGHGRTGRCPRTLWLCVALLAGAPLASGHPLVQGTLAVEVGADRILVRATVTREEVLVAAARAPAGAGSFVDQVRMHGRYLTDHLRVRVDGRLLPGRVLRCSDGAAGARPTYLLEYGPTVGRPTRLELEQDVLSDVPFALGNAWETSFVVRLSRPGQEPGEASLLTARRPLTWPLSRSESAGRGLTGPFVRYGVAHILGGYDHVLFVVALVLAAESFWELAKVVGVFTLAHSVTLALSALSVVHLPAAVVEPAIAASIVCVSVQSVLWPERSHGRSRLLVAFAFGLFHGLGFAGGLLAAMSRLPAASALWAIAAFSVGVELGHQVVVLPAFAGLRLVRVTGDGPGRRARGVVRGGSALIALLGCVYLVTALR